eukprot:TRINITY_DN11009_c0_g1_i1.p1 TRINITY_DN11009_c0_g1~~TRINITY_DN11009_c0_g1_i1.p1  ORF type:complete len:205 (+),score=24.25 TRINITY_DN11009_c0_g1_i1:39-653(+)
MATEPALQELLLVLRNAGKSDYIGEPVSQLEHALQCAKFAKDSGADDATVLAALFHDIGHLCPSQPEIARRLGIEEDIESMGAVGVMQHEILGADYVRAVGFPKKVGDLVKGHVQAKRYLVWKIPGYYDKLSPASKETLGYQGGPMQDAEAKAFEESDLFDTILKMRTWDDKGKLENYPVPDLDSYKPMMYTLLGLCPTAGTTV